MSVHKMTKQGWIRITDPKEKIVCEDGENSILVKIGKKRFVRFIKKD